MDGSSRKEKNHKKWLEKQQRRLEEALDMQQELSDDPNIYCQTEKQAEAIAMEYAGVSKFSFAEKVYMENCGENMNKHIRDTHIDVDQSDSYFEAKIYSRGKHLPLQDRFVAIVKHKYGHYQSDMRQLSLPHLHVYKVSVDEDDHSHRVIQRRRHATAYAHYFWNEYKDENQEKNRGNIEINLARQNQSINLMISHANQNHQQIKNQLPFKWERFTAAPTNCKQAKRKVSSPSPVRTSSYSTSSSYKASTINPSKHQEQMKYRSTMPTPSEDDLQVGDAVIGGLIGGGIGGVAGTVAGGIFYGPVGMVVGGTVGGTVGGAIGGSYNTGWSGKGALIGAGVGAGTGLAVGGVSALVTVGCSSLLGAGATTATGTSTAGTTATTVAKGGLAFAKDGLPIVANTLISGGRGLLGM